MSLVRLNLDFRTISQLKNVFWSNIFVGASFQILDNHQVACGLKLGSAAILNQNPIFETAYKCFDTLISKEVVIYFPLLSNLV